MSAHTVESVAANLRAIRRSASRAQATEGRKWYASAREFILKLRDECAERVGDYSMTDDFAIGVVAAYSQNSTWKANVTMARKYLSGEYASAYAIGKGGLENVRAEVLAMEAGENPLVALVSHGVTAPKRPAFFRNLSGDMSAVTCDRWHLRAAFGENPPTLTDDVCAIVTEATAKVAREYRESPAQCQAVIWCAVRGDGK